MQVPGNYGIFVINRLARGMSNSLHLESVGIYQFLDTIMTIEKLIIEARLLPAIPVAAISEC